MYYSFFKSVSFLGLGLTAVFSLVLFFLKSWAWGSGTLVGSLWVFLNSFFLYQLLEIGLNAKPRQKERILVFSILKFPVLYIAGFFILKTRFFPVTSVLLGLTLYFVALGVVWIWFNLKATLKIAALVCTLGAWSGVARASESKESSYEILNFVELISHYLGNTPLSHLLHRYETVIFNVLVIALVSLIFFLASRRMPQVPGRLQAACEAIVEWLDNFVCGILGPQGKQYTPFLGTLFIYILAMNLIGLVPLMKAPTSTSIIMKIGLITIPVPTVTAALAIIVFCYVQFTGIKEQGLAGYLDHMAGTPRDIFGYVLMPLMFVIHLIGEFAKPLSLMFRLYGNVWGEDVLLAVFMSLGIGMLAFLPIPAAAPLHFPFLLLAMVTGTIQAFVFTLLSTVYIAMMLPHEHKEADPHAVSHSH